MANFEHKHTLERNPRIDIQQAISQAMGNVLGLDQIAPTVLDRVSHLFRGADLALSLSVRHEEKQFPVWAMGEEQEKSNFFLQRGILWDTAQSVHQQGFEAISDEFHVSAIEDSEGINGLLVLHRGNKQMAQVVDTLAAELSKAAAHIENITDVQRLAREMEILNRTAKSLTTSFDLDNILVATMQGIWELFPGFGALLTLIDFDTERNYIKIPLDGETDHVLHYESNGKVGLVHECIDNQATLLLQDASVDNRYNADVDGVVDAEVASYACVPLLVHERALGAISVFDKRINAFSRRELDLLMAFAASVAVAISNARLFHEVTTANKDLESSRLEIEQSRNTLLALFDNLDDELYIIDDQYQLIAVNRARAQRVGRSPQEIVGSLCFEVLENQSAPCAGCLAHTTFAKNKKTIRTEHTTDSQQQAVTREIYTYPILDANDDVKRTILQLRDVSERRRLQTSLIQAEKLATLGELAAGVAHELNNPITAVIVNAQLLQRELDNKSVDIESVELIKRAGKRAQNVVRELLDFARQDPQQFQSIDVNTTIEQALSLVDRQWESTNVNLELKLADDLPTLLGNGDHLQSVWSNLLINAHDALEDRPGDIRVTSRQDKDSIVVLIEDSGMGIKPEDLQKIFDPFFTTKAPGKGTGLGLATCFRIIQEHKGVIDVESTLGQGARFTVKLPIQTTSD